MPASRLLTVTRPTQLIDCSTQHVEPIRTIFNEVIAHSTALWDYHPRSVERVEAWVEDKRRQGLPLLGLVDHAGALLGFASYGPFRPWQAYQYSAEHCVYVDRAHRGRGVGRKLLSALIERAEAAQLRTLIGGITADNQASITLHTQLGFQPAGTIVSAGFKFGSWIDLAFYQLILPGPTEPREA